MIPEKNPNTLEESLHIFETIGYESYGFGVMFLDYNYTFGYWSVSFRNPKNFTNPNIKEDTPLKAVHAMLDFLRILQENFKSGWIESFDDDKIICRLHKEYELDEYLTLDRRNLTDEQNATVADGSIIRYDKENDKIQFLKKDGKSWM